ncbi:MAG: enoyl-CoA hydratase/isomerase family protein [Alphaproteobacteria bacterium]
MAGSIRESREDGIHTIVLDRPGKLNALDRGMWCGLADAVAALARDDSVRCIILRGAGGDAFCAGHDIEEFETEFANFDDALAYAGFMGDIFVGLRDCRHPTMALIEGACVGGGLELALACDLRIAGASARFGLPISRIGVALIYPFMAALVEAVGRPTALEILLEARVFGADEAERKGLITRHVADDELEAEAQRMARRIAGGAPLANRWNKAFAARVTDPAPISDAEFAESVRWSQSEDFKSGFRAFLAKRKAVFTGR